MKRVAQTLLRRFSDSRSLLSGSPKFLITGSQGQIGTELIGAMRKRYGDDNVIASDIRLPEDYGVLYDGPYCFLDVMNKQSLIDVVKREEITSIVHLGAFLSAAAENNPHAALELQTMGLHNVLDVALEYECQCFAPSSIAAFGPTTPLDETPDITSQRPRSIYGVGKVYAELLGEYYHCKRDLDFRSLRYPGVISWKTVPEGGTTDYSVDMFYSALRGETYQCYIDEHEPLPMMYMPDCIKSTIDLLEAKPKNLTHRTYNVTGMSFTPGELQEAIQGCGFPDFEVIYEPDDLRQPLAHSWPNSLDDSHAREDWDWDPEFDLEGMCLDMFENLRRKLTEAGETLVG